MFGSFYGKTQTPNKGRAAVCGLVTTQATTSHTSPAHEPQPAPAYGSREMEGKREREREFREGKKNGSVERRSPMGWYSWSVKMFLPSNIPATRAPSALLQLAQ